MRTLFGIQTLVAAVYEEIAAHGVDGLRMNRLADRLQLSVGTLYNMWGGRLLCLEQTWRYTMQQIDKGAAVLRHSLSPTRNGIDALWGVMDEAMPPPVEAFLELHATRRRWMRGTAETEGAYIPGLLEFVDAAQRLGHVRRGPAPLMASLIWWFFLGAISSSLRRDRDHMEYSRIALKRLLLTARSFSQDMDSLEIEDDGSFAPELNLTLPGLR